MLKTDNVDMACAIFFNTFKILHNLHCPERKIKIKQMCKKKNPGLQMV